MAHTQQLDATFAALSDPTRRAILARLGDGTATVSELAEPFAMSLPAISKHLKVLEAAGLIRRQKSGRNYHCSLRADPMQEAADWIARYRQFWAGNLRNLAGYLQSIEGEGQASAPKKKTGKTRRTPSPSRPSRKTRR